MICVHKGRTDGRTVGRTVGRRDGRTDGGTDGRSGGRTDKCGRAHTKHHAHNTERAADLAGAELGSVLNGTNPCFANACFAMPTPMVSLHVRDWYVQPK